jgi:NAD(P)-dependent dehydrogenase (short-subunit alcohol dehydrogenase family)
VTGASRGIGRASVLALASRASTLRNGEQPNRDAGRHIMDDGDFAFDPESDRYTSPAGKKLVQFWRTYVAQERHNTRGDMRQRR